MVSALAFLFVLEICARIDDSIQYGAPLWEEYSSERLRHQDRDGIPRNVPNARFEKWQNNRHGFRGPDFLQEKPAGTIRIVCLGASETYGLYESYGKEWPAQLQEILHSTRYQVINASVVGLAFHDYKSYTEKYILPLNPDIVVVLVNPIFYVLRIDKLNISSDTPKQKTNRRQNNISGFINIIVTNIRFLPKLKQVIKQSVLEGFPSLLKGYQIWNIKRQLRGIESYHLKERIPLDTVPDYYAKEFRNELNEFLSYANSKGMQVMLTTYPSLISRDNLNKYQEIFLDARRFSVQLSFIGMVDALDQFNSVITQVAYERKVMFANCQSTVPKTTDYFRDNVHYTDIGALLIAKTIAGGLQTTGH